MSSQNGEKALSKETKESPFRAFLTKLRKRHIIETLAAFIGGGWLLIEVVERLLVSHYHFPERAIDITVITLIGTLVCILLWRWFSGREEPRKFKPELFLIPLVVLITIILDTNLFLHLQGLESESAFLSDERGSSTHLDSKRIVVAIFANETGDPKLEPVGSMAADWITQGLQQTGLVAVAPTPLDELTSSQREGKKRLQDIARETGAGTVVSGAYYLQGNILRFQAQVTDERKGKLLAALEPVTGPADDPTQPIQFLRQKVMGILASVFDPNLKAFMAPDSQPPTYEAYLQYLEGFKLFMHREYEKAIGPLNRAIALDSSFQFPLFMIAMAHFNLGEYNEVGTVRREIEKDREKLSPFNRNMLDLMDDYMKGDRYASYLASSQIASLFPSDQMYYQAGLDAMGINHPREAVDFLKKCDPRRESMKVWTAYWSVLTKSYHMLGNHKQELKEARWGRKQYPERFSTLSYEVRALAALGRIDEINKKIEESLTFPPERGWNPGEVMNSVGNELRVHGYREASLRVLDRAIRWFKGRPQEEAKSEAQRLSMGVALYTAERWEEVRTLFEELLKDAPDNMDYLLYVGTTAARMGDKEKAAKVSEQLANLKRPYLFGWNTYYRACIASILGDKESAMSLLRDALAQGVVYDQLYEDMDLENLRDYPPFKELIKPKG